MQALPKVRWAGSPAGDRGVALRGDREDDLLRLALEEEADLPPPRGALPLAQDVDTDIVIMSPSVIAEKMRDRDRFCGRRMGDSLLR